MASQNRLGDNFLHNLLIPSGASVSCMQGQKWCSPALMSNVTTQFMYFTDRLSVSWNKNCHYLGMDVFFSIYIWYVFCCESQGIVSCMTLKCAEALNMPNVSSLHGFCIFRISSYYIMLHVWINMVISLQWRHHQRDDVLIVCLTFCWGADHRKYQSTASLAFMRGIHRWPVDSPHKGPVTQKNVSIWKRHHDV